MFVIIVIQTFRSFGSIHILKSPKNLKSILSTCMIEHVTKNLSCICGVRLRDVGTRKFLCEPGISTYCIVTPLLYGQFKVLEFFHEILYQFLCKWYENQDFPTYIWSYHSIIYLPITLERIYDHFYAVTFGCFFLKFCHL